MTYKGFGEVLLYQRFVPKNSPDLRIGVFFGQNSIWPKMMKLVGLWPPTSVQVLFRIRDTPRRASHAELRLLHALDFMLCGLRQADS